MVKKNSNKLSTKRKALPNEKNYFIFNSKNNIDVDVSIIYTTNMNTVDFINWLITSKKLSNRSAKDVVSRCKRISKLNNDTELDKVNYEIFINSEVFLSQTIFIKSQLKRAFNLYIEFRKSK